MALYTAAKMGHNTVVRHVLPVARCPGMDVPHPSEPGILHLSATCGPVGVLTALVDAGVDVNARTTAQGMPPLLAFVCGIISSLRTWGRWRTGRRAWDAC